MKVKLFTADGGLVTEGEIPPFNEAPDVLMWGERVFVLDDEGADVVHYFEAFTHTLPSQP